MTTPQETFKHTSISWNYYTNLVMPFMGTNFVDSRVIIIIDPCEPLKPLTG